MAFEIRCKTWEEASRLHESLTRVVKRSRFTAYVGFAYRRRRGGCVAAVTLNEVRLRESKHYCGSHPGPCLRGSPNDKHRKAKWLEGADWVAFNDMLNDVLDMADHAGDAGSSHVEIRRGGRRRVRYEQFMLGPNHADWVKKGEDADYEDHRWSVARELHPPPSWLPPGTPGLSGWKRQPIGGSDAELPGALRDRPRRPDRARPRPPQGQGDRVRRRPRQGGRGRPGQGAARGAGAPGR